MSAILQFGERLDEYAVPVLNEREVRASAGILFMFAMISFMNAWLTGEFLYTRIFVVAFLIDFSIRIFVNPKYAPTMIIGRFFVRRQVEEYVGAPQKRFAWSIGLALAVTMFFLIVVNNVIGPLNLFICLTCLLLMFFESAFGICLACKIYNFAFKEQAQLCPGNVCAVDAARPATRITAAQVVVAVIFMIAVVAAGRFLATRADASAQANAGTVTASGQAIAPSRDCTVPDWAVAIGHTEKWKLHNGCAGAGPATMAATATAVVQPQTMEIIAMRHPPVQKALASLRDWLARQGDRVRVIEIDAESPQGERRLADAGLKGHIPILILIGGKYRFQRPDGTPIELLNFPSAADNPMGMNGTWAPADVERIIGGGRQ